MSDAVERTAAKPRRPSRISRVEVKPRRASNPASTPLCAARPAWKGLDIDPKTSRTPAACVPAMPSAYVICSSSNPSSRPAAPAAPNTPHVPVMCQPAS